MDRQIYLSLRCGAEDLMAWDEERGEPPVSLFLGDREFEFVEGGSYREVG